MLRKLAMEFEFHRSKVEEERLSMSTQVNMLAQEVRFHSLIGDVSNVETDCLRETPGNCPAHRIGRSTARLYLYSIFHWTFPATRRSERHLFFASQSYTACTFLCAATRKGKDSSIKQRCHEAKLQERRVSRSSSTTAPAYPESTRFCSASTYTQSDTSA